MINLDIYNHPQALRIFLCKPDNTFICELNGIEPESGSIKINLNNQNELEFDYYRYIYNYGERTQSNGYNELQIGMRLFVENVGYFRIKFPPYTDDGDKEFKHVTAYSIDNELEDKHLALFKINTGEEQSMENLVRYNRSPYYTQEEYEKIPSPKISYSSLDYIVTPIHNQQYYIGTPKTGYTLYIYDGEIGSFNVVGETEDLLNPYTGLPYDYIVFYNTFPAQLNALKTKYSDGTITDEDSVDEIVKYCELIPRLRRKANRSNGGGKIISVTEYVEFNYDTDGTTITSVKLTDIKNRIEQLISFYTKYGRQLSLLDLAIENSGCQWDIGDIAGSADMIRLSNLLDGGEDDYIIAQEILDLAKTSPVNKRFQFDIEDQNIYSFLTQDVAGQSKCLAYFDYIHFTINYKDINSLGMDSGVVLDKHSLLNNINVNVAEDNIVTRYNVSGGDGLDLLDVNFGSNRIVNIDYYINAKDDNGSRIYNISESLAEKYNEYKGDVEKARNVYIQTARQVRQIEKDIDDAIYRVPNDIVKTDWGTFKKEELEAALKQYTNMLNTLKSLYKEEYPDGIKPDPDQSIDEDVIKNTIYWHDYYAYKQAIEQINAAIDAINDDSSYDDIDDETVLDKINAWETEWSLFGIKELQSKLAAYKEKMKALVKNKSVIIGTNGKVKVWDEKDVEDDEEVLSDAEKAEFNKSKASYDDARKIYNQMILDSASCAQYLGDLQEDVETMKQDRSDMEQPLNRIKELVSLKGYSRKDLHNLVSDVDDEELSFTEPEVKTIIGFYSDGSYQNSNILKTSVDDIVSVIDIEKELLDDAVEQLSIASKPQFTFTTNIDNVLIIPEFQGYKFDVGNYVYVQYYDDFYVKLRLDTITFNPFSPESDINVTFTNYTTSNAKRSDLSYILKNNSSSGCGSSSGGGGDSDDSFGNSDKIDVTLSNTMLSKLLNTELFATRVTDAVLDTLRLNNLNVRYATFGSLADGQTTIDGACIKTGAIQSNNYSDTPNQLAGSKLNLNDGTFSFGGGNLTYSDGILSVNGAIKATTLGAGGRTSTTGATGLFIDGSGNLYAGSSNQTQINADGTFRFGGEKLKFENNTLTVQGAITATTLSTGDKTTASTSANGIFINDQGNLYAGSDNKTIIYADGTFSFGGGKLAYSNDVLSVNGSITATSGIISGDLTLSGSLTHAYDKYSVTTRGVQSDGTQYGVFYITEYTDEDRDTIKSFPFRVNGDGSFTATKATIAGEVTATQLTAKQSFYIYDTDFNERKKVINFVPDQSTDTTFNFGRLDALYGKYNLIQFKDMSNWRYCSVYCDAFSYEVGASTVSDKRIKNSIEPLDNFEETFMSLKPCRYKLNAGNSGRYHFGFIADEVKEVIEKNGYSTSDFAGYVRLGKRDDYPEINDLTGLRYEEFISWNTHMIQKCVYRIRELEAQIKELKGE